MKVKNWFLIPFVTLAVACVRPSEPIIYSAYTPILITKASLHQSIRLEAPKAIEDAAKIYHKGSLIYISERFKGVHIIDNADPSQPKNKGFIAVPGCVDMAVKKDVLYVDNAIDLVSISLTAAENGKLEVLKRVENVFPEVSAPDGGAVPSKFNQHNRPANTVIIGWRK